ncbi:thioredoxin [Selenomonas sp. ND2010]|uniref:thioredoxin n=1 Tax=Selenomonas sp. ND2010 TaxID=1410618 RepID=UPI0021013496|nr:thioredoxin [Selenomonas sp. ND2010]
MRTKRRSTMDIITITKDNFQAEVIEAKGTVLIDFWASWCGPCRMLSPIVDQVAEEHPDIKVGKINVDEEPELASQFDVMSIPMLVVFKDGQKVNESVGLIPKEKVEELIP